MTVTGTITVYNLKLAWNYLFEHLNSLVDFEFVAKINSILGASLVHNAGCIRNIPVGISGTAWQPEMPDFDTAKAAIEKIANMEPGRERALKMFGYLCRSQLFSDPLYFKVEPHCVFVMVLHGIAKTLIFLSVQTFTKQRN